MEVCHGQHNVHGHLCHHCPCTVPTGCVHQPGVAAPSFTGAAHNAELNMQALQLIGGAGISPHQLLQTHCLAAEPQHYFSCCNNDKATLASQIKVSPASGGSETNVCMHRYYTFMPVLMEVWQKPDKAMFSGALLLYLQPFSADERGAVPLGGDRRQKGGVTWKSQSEVNHPQGAADSCQLETLLPGEGTGLTLTGVQQNAGGFPLTLKLPVVFMHPLG